MGLLSKLFSSHKPPEKPVEQPPDGTVQRERRNTQRRAVRLPAEMGFGLSGIAENVYVRDFSDQGMYLLTNYHPGHGSEIDVYMNLPEGSSERRVHYVASVKRVDEFRSEGIYGVAAIIRRCEVVPEPQEPATEPQTHPS